MTSISSLDVVGLDRVVRAFAELLDRHQHVINQLNVYPVPDGDTGTNMALTLKSVVAEIDGLTDPDMNALCAGISHGSLMGARGNSGVISSQILRGLSGVVRDHEQIDGPLIAEALTAASVAADGAVGRPVEGTILTVLRDAAAGATEAAANGGDLNTTLDAALSAGSESLARTPELLPVLAAAGVVDAGGAGLMLFFEAALHVCAGRDLPEPPVASEEVLAATALAAAHGDAHGDAHGGDELRYEVMYLLEAPDDSIAAFKDVWAGIGDSIVVVGGDGLFNCHIHTDDIGAAIEAALDIGRPRQIRVTDLDEQVEELAWVTAGSADAGTEVVADPVDCAVVAVSPADGTSRIFHSLRVQGLVPGGQSMNPSTEQLLAAVEAAPSSAVVVLPNNSNIIPVARQVDELTDKTVYVVPTRSVVEGFAALLSYDPVQAGEVNASAMTEAAEAVVTGEVVQAVRNTSTDLGAVEVGDWIGISSLDGIRAVAGSAAEAAIRLLDHLVAEHHELLTIIEGEGATTAITRQLVSWIGEHRPDAEVEIHPGGQPHYPYLFGVE